MAFLWRLFDHDPVIGARAVVGGPMWAQCSCGWKTLPVPREYTQAVIDAERHHIDEALAAQDQWFRREAATAGSGPAARP